MRLFQQFGRSDLCEPTRRDMRDKELPEEERILRYWVQIRDRQTGSVSTLPLDTITRIHIPRKKNEPQRPSEEIFRLKDGLSTLEARSFEELAARTLHSKRDCQAEMRRADAKRQ